jgi:hypothetical protein
MHLDAIRVEAHYSALLAERSNMIVSLVGQIEELQARIADLEQQLTNGEYSMSETVSQLDKSTLLQE